MFAPMQSDRHAIVLTDDELEAYVAKFGPMYPARIAHFAISHDGKRAIIELNQSWTGGTFLLTKTDSGWEATQISMWIT